MSKHVTGASATFARSIGQGRYCGGTTLTIPARPLMVAQSAGPTLLDCLTCKSGTLPDYIIAAKLRLHGSRGR